MNTNNIISTPDITGNIGSCELKTVNIQIGNTLFTEKYQSTVLNSCSGEIVSSNAYTTYSGLWGIPALLIIFVVVLAISLSDK